MASTDASNAAVMRSLAGAVARALRAAVLCTLPLAAGAETLLLESVEQAPPNSPAGVERPAAGATMAAVEAAFGAPQARFAPVGEPPISRWRYPAFTVYFERNRVIHSVLNRSEQP